MKTCKTLWNWRRVRYLVGSLLAVGLWTPCGICQGETVYDAAADLTDDSIADHANPNGPWSYGYRDSAVSNDFTPFTSSGARDVWVPGTADVQGWWPSGGNGAMMGRPPRKTPPGGRKGVTTPCPIPIC